MASDPAKSGGSGAGDDERRLRREYGLDNPPKNPLATAASAGFEFAGIVIVASTAGYFLDRHFQTSPVIMLILALLSMAGGLYRVIRKILAMGR
jgi:F0F1-type ATP synthase assembly protein I